MFAPHDGEHAELGKIWFAAQDRCDAFELLFRQTMLAHQFGRKDRSHAATDRRVSTKDLNSCRPSSLPRRPSPERSGCGISPRTFPAGLQIPAMLFRLPFGFASGVG